MDPLIVLFGLGVGVLIGMTGIGGGSLMTPLLILVFGIEAAGRHRHGPGLRRADEDAGRLAPLPQGDGRPGRRAVAVRAARRPARSAA